MHISHKSIRPSRRALLRGSVAGAFVLGTFTEFGGRAAAAAMTDGPMPNAFVKIAPDSTVTVMIKHLDKGQGVTTGLTTIVAEELDADWGQMRFAFAPANPALYNNLLFGPIQATGGSTSTANSWMQLRRAGAAARAMLVAAAAEQWKVPAAKITVSKGVISGPGGKTSAFGPLAAAAAKQPVPTEVTLKDPKNFTLIGTKLPRLDSVEKTTGKTVFALDIRRPGQRTAVVARSPRFGGTVASFDATAARAVPGVVDVVQIPQGVAVVATDTYAAMKGREALVVTWDDSKAETRSSDAMLAEYRTLAQTPGVVAIKTGDTDAAFKGAAHVVEAEFQFPYLAHAPLEPLNATIEANADGTVTVYAGSQFQTIEQAVVAAFLGTTPDKVLIETHFAGGSFGRRATPDADYFGQAAAILAATGKKYPIHLVYTREDDIRGGRYRPMFLHQVRAAISDKGQLTAWQQRLVGQSFINGTALAAAYMKDGLDPFAVEGTADMPYAIPNMLVDWQQASSPVTTLWWRSVGHTHTAQAVEVMMDELATTAGQDPVAFRLAMLTDKPRHAAVLKLAAEKANWTGSGKLPEGRGRGVAMHESFGSYVAMIVDVTVAPDGAVKCDRVVAAVDCGIAVNPDVVRAQVEGGVGFALGAALRNRVTFKDGMVEQANFDAYQPLRLSDMPVVEVHIVPSAEAPTGIGEPGVPPVAPAVSNAIFAATGKRVRSLPFELSMQGA